MIKDFAVKFRSVWFSAYPISRSITPFERDEDKPKLHTIHHHLFGEISLPKHEVCVIYIVIKEHSSNYSSVRKGIFSDTKKVINILTLSPSPHHQVQWAIFCLWQVTVAFNRVTQISNHESWLKMTVEVRGWSFECQEWFNCLLPQVLQY